MLCASHEPAAKNVSAIVRYQIGKPVRILCALEKLAEPIARDEIARVERSVFRRPARRFAIPKWFANRIARCFVQRDIHACPRIAPRSCFCALAPQLEARKQIDFQPARKLGRPFDFSDQCALALRARCVTGLRRELRERAALCSSHARGA